MLHGIRRSTVGTRNPFPTKSCSCKWQQQSRRLRRADGAASRYTRQHSGSPRARSSRYRYSAAARIPRRPVRTSRLDAFFFYPDASPADAIRLRLKQSARARPYVHRICPAISGWSYFAST
ncbi:hypothetical protein MTO96_007973 [Rhipicephalus appendiculatus]